jgi:hypothetical protein
MRPNTLATFAAVLLSAGPSIGCLVGADGADPDPDLDPEEVGNAGALDESEEDFEAESVDEVDEAPDVIAATAVNPSILLDSGEKALFNKINAYRAGKALPAMRMSVYVLDQAYWYIANEVDGNPSNPPSDTVDYVRVRGEDAATAFANIPASFKAQLANSSGVNAENELAISPAGTAYVRVMVGDMSKEGHSGLAKFDNVRLEAF